MTSGASSCLVPRSDLCLLVGLLRERGRSTNRRRDGDSMSWSGSLSDVLTLGGHGNGRDNESGRRMLELALPRGAGLVSDTVHLGFLRSSGTGLGRLRCPAMYGYLSKPREASLDQGCNGQQEAALWVMTSDRRS